MKKIFYITLIALPLFFSINTALAIEPLVQCGNNCGLNDFWNTAINGAKIMLGLTGSLALLFFIYGGVLFLLSGGNADMVTKGKKAIIGSAIGILIVFGSWTIIKEVINIVAKDGTTIKNESKNIELEIKE